MGDRRDDDTQGVLTAKGFEPITPIPYGKNALVARLGRGGMADVFLAISAGVAGFRKLLVIKRLHAHLEKNHAFVQMFLDEARLAARLNHANVVQTYEVGEVHGSHYLAMELLEGQTLSRILHRFSRASQQVPWALAVHIIGEVLEGLHYAHELADFDGTPLGVVHRDISPGNVMVTYDGMVKLVDFGIAKAATQSAATDPKMRKGKFSYIAPEQAAGKADRRSDVWSVGVVLWETLTGKKLFSGDGPAETLEQAMNAPIPPLSSVTSVRLPRPLDAVITRALARKPERRYPTAKHMRDHLDQVLKGSGAVVRRADVAAFMEKVFSDVREAHGKALRECMAAGLKTATSMSEMPPPPALTEPEDRAEAGDDKPAERRPLSALTPFAGLPPAWLRTDRRVLYGGAAAIAGVILTVVLAFALGGGEAEPTPPTEPAHAAGAPADAGAPVAAAEPDAEAPPPTEPDPAIDVEARDRAREEGLAHFRARRYAQAAEAYTRCTEADPTYAGCFAALGAAELEMDQGDAAVEAYRQAARLAPEHSGYHAALGRALRSTGQTDLAIAVYRRALELDPQNGAARQALRELGAR